MYLCRRMARAVRRSLPTSLPPCGPEAWRWAWTCSPVVSSSLVSLLSASIVTIVGRGQLRALLILSMELQESVCTSVSSARFNCDFINAYTYNMLWDACTHNVLKLYLCCRWPWAEMQFPLTRAPPPPPADGRGRSCNFLWREPHAHICLRIRCC